MPDAPPLTEAALLQRVALGEHTRQQFKRSFHSPDPDTPQVTPQVEQLLCAMTGKHSRKSLQNLLGLADRGHFRKTYLQPTLAIGLVELTLPEKPSSRLQKYCLTE